MSYFILVISLQHNRFLSDAKGKDADVIFIGDSILQALEHTEVWNQWFAPLHCLNFSIHKDQTQNVLWRIKNGELDHVDPKVSIIIINVIPIYLYYGIFC